METKKTIEIGGSKFPHPSKLNVKGFLAPGTTSTYGAKKWNSGTKNILETAKIEDLPVKRFKSGAGPSASVYNNHPVAEEELPAFANSSLFRKLFNIPCTISDDGQMDHGTHDFSYSNPHFVPVCKICKQFFTQFVLLCPNKLKELACKTSYQNDDLWKEARRIRISASAANAVPKRPTTDPENYLNRKLYNAFQGNLNTDYGNWFENKARSDFIAESRCSVSVQSGFIVRGGDEWLGASPDGLVDNDAVLEIKCPVKSISELLYSNKYDVRLDEDGEPYLKENGPNGYYMQIQLQMYCTNRQVCYFYLWSPKEKICIVVDYNSEYVQQNVIRLRQFYFTKLLPKIVTDFCDKRFVLHDKYKQFVM